MAVTKMRTNGARFVHTVCFVLMLGTSGAVRAQNAVAPESSLKAAYLYHFIQFTEWPSAVMESLDSFKVCIIAEEQWEPALAKMNGKIAHGKPIELRAYDNNPPIRCQVVVFNSGDPVLLKKQRLNLIAFNTLTVSLNPQINSDDAIITLLLVEGHIAFSIDKTLAKSSGLDISSKLLRLARSVK